MSIPQKLARFLERRIPFLTKTHPEAFHALQAAEASHVPGQAFAKPVILNADGKICMAVVPATEHVDLQRLGKCLGAAKVRLAKEAEFSHLFPDCDARAIPIFGSPYGVPVLIAHELTDNEEIAFSAGNGRETVTVRVRDYLAMEKPLVCPRERILARAS